jgi:hypothetical protein
MAKVTFCHVRSTLTDDMQEIQLLLVQSQTTLAQLAFELMALLGLGLVWLLVALGPQSPWANAWRSLFSRVARLTIGLGLLWLTVMVSAWPPLLERTGNVLGPMIAGLVAVMLVTETLAYRLAQHPSHVLRSMAAWLTAIGFSLAFALVLLAQSWMREPMGAALIDGRYQVIEWSAIVQAQAFSRALLATAFSAALLLAVLAQWSVQTPNHGVTGSIITLSSTALSTTGQRAMTGIGVAGLLGLLWLLNQAVGGQLNPTTQGTQTLYDALLYGAANWPLRLTFVLWLVTLAGLVVGLGSAGDTRKIAAWITRLPVISAPLLWLGAWWQLFISPQPSLTAGLPLADLVSMLPAWALAAGLALVALVVVLSFGLFVRFLVRAHPDSHHAQGART